MIERTKILPGEIADCGVFRGASIAGMGLYLRQHRIKKTIYGFDSFEGFDPESAAADMKLGGAENEDRHEHGFSATSMNEVTQKARRFHLNVLLVPGYFSQSFPTLPKSIRFCFAHLDVNLYDSYKQCLNSSIHEWLQAESYFWTNITIHPGRDVIGRWMSSYVTSRRSSD